MRYCERAGGYGGGGEGWMIEKGDAEVELTMSGWRRGHVEGRGRDNRCGGRV
jgi:hypothetical protein